MQVLWEPNGESDSPFYSDLLHYSDSGGQKRPPGEVMFALKLEGLGALHLVHRSRAGDVKVPSLSRDEQFLNVVRI